MVIKNKTLTYLGATTIVLFIFASIFYELEFEFATTVCAIVGYFLSALFVSLLIVKICSNE
jgi:hypothetical protein